MDRSLTIGLVSFAVTASLLAIPAIANSHGGRDWSQPMTRAQMENRIAERFAAADADGSGAVSREEAAAYRAVRQAERQARRFARMDVDGDGEISIAERDAAAAARMERRGVRRSDLMAEHRDMRAQVSTEDMARMAEGRAESAPVETRPSRRVMRIERRNQAWQAADADGNGALNAAEFETMVAARRDRMRQRAAAAGRPDRGTTRFDRMDTDGDGALTLAEMSVRPLAMFARADADNDGVVTREERRAARQAMRAERRQRR